jgi:hypothetical protein
MKLTNVSENIISFVNEFNIIEKSSKKLNNETIHIFTHLYEIILKSYKYFLKMKENKLIKCKMTKYNKHTQVTKPIIFNDSTFPADIINIINTTSSCEICYSFIILNKRINIYFILNDLYDKINKEKYDSHAKLIIMWLFIAISYAQKDCSDHYSIYLYFTNHNKTLPIDNKIIIDRIHVNTAFTRSCNSPGEIVVFRKEEWFKVFIHETFHSFNLDFSNMYFTETQKNIKQIFNIDTNIDLFEAYTEFWALIIHTIFCSFYLIQDKHNINLFLKTAANLIYIERSYSFFQMVKILDYMGIKYNNLHSTDNISVTLKDMCYKDKTNVLCYYIIKLVLLDNYQDFFMWCLENNINLLMFNIDEKKKQLKFVNFIETHYKTKLFLSRVKKAELLFKRLKLMNGTYLLKNTRMSAIELK